MVHSVLRTYMWFEFINGVEILHVLAINLVEDPALKFPNGPK